MVYDFEFRDSSFWGFREFQKPGKATARISSASWDLLRFHPLRPGTMLVGRKDGLSEFVGNILSPTPNPTFFLGSL